MKIFTNRFCLEFMTCPPEEAFRFERLTLPEAAEKMLQSEPLFPGQVYYVDATTEKAFSEDLFALQTDPKVGGRNLGLCICFPTDEENQAFVSAFCEKHFVHTPAAGGVVLGPKEEVLMIFREGQWDLPKGHIEKGEDTLTAAVREVAEETGLRGHRVREKLPVSYHIYPLKGAWRLKETHWYLMDSEETPELVPQVKEKITKAEWWKNRRLRTEMPDTYPTITELLKRVMRKSSE